MQLKRSARCSYFLNRPEAYRISWPFVSGNCGVENAVFPCFSIPVFQRTPLGEASLVRAALENRSVST